MASRASRTPSETQQSAAASAQMQGRSVLLFITLASIGDAVITTDSTGGVTFLNPVAQELTGWELQESVGVDIEEVFVVVDEATGQPLPNPVKQSLSQLRKVELPPDAILVKKDGTRIPVEDSAAPIMGEGGEVLGTVLVFRDITERKKAEQMVKYRSELDRMVARISTAFITSSVYNVDWLIDGALREIGQFLHADRVYVFLYSKDALNVICTNEWRAPGIESRFGLAGELHIDKTPYWSGKILNGEYIYVSKLEDIPENAKAERELWIKSGVQSFFAVPMYVEDRVLGFIGIDTVNEARRWPEETVNLLYVIGNVFASAMERRDALDKLQAAREREMQIGMRIQQTLLLSEAPVSFADFEVSAITIPSKGIDGDFYDFLQHPNMALDVIFGDVMGKGVPAALMAAGGKTEFLRTLTHLLAGSPRGTIPQPQDIVNSVHHVLTPQLINLDSFITLSYVRFDSRSKKVTVVDAGNTRLIRCKASDGQIEFLSGYNLPLGFELSEVYAQAEFTYEPDDVFVFYSDGVTEARNPKGEMFGLQRLQKLIHEKRDLPPRMIVDAIREAAIVFVGSEALTDDFTCVVIKTVTRAAIEPSVGVEELQIKSALVELPSIRAFLKQFCDKRNACGLSEYELRLLELAATEVGSNIIKHAYRGRKDQPIWVRVDLTRSELRVRFTHTGEPFVGPESISLPALDHQKEGGFGLFIINQVADRVEYSVDTEGRQYIELTKKVGMSGG